MWSRVIVARFRFLLLLAGLATLCLAGSAHAQNDANTVIQLDSVMYYPVSYFPDLPEEQKAWMREDKYWSQMLYFYLIWSKERNKEAIFNLYKDGPEYLAQAKSRIPYLPEHKAFVLYLCWEQSKLRGTRVVLEKYDDNSATISLKPIYFRLYKNIPTYQKLIPLEDYRGLFENIWTDRCANAGWGLQIDYKDDESCVFKLTKI